MTPSPVSQPLPVIAAHPSLTGMGVIAPGAPPKQRSVGPWLILVALAGVAATLTTIVIMRDKGEPAQPTQPIAAAQPDAKVVTDDDRVLPPDEPVEAPRDAMKTSTTPVRTDEPDPKPGVRDPKPRDTKRPPTYRPPTKRTGSVDKPATPDPEPTQPTPTEAPRPAVVDPPKVVVDPPRPVDKPIEAPRPVDPPKPTRTPVVAASAVTKVAGELPAMRVNSGDEAGVMAKLCIDEAGKVTSVKLVKAPSYLSSDLTRALSSWKYKPYTNRDSKLSPACFVVSLRLVVK